VDIRKHGSKTIFLLHIKYPQHSRTEEDKYVGKDNVYFLKMRYKIFLKLTIKKSSLAIN
jgi:hypothetical protein